MLLGCIADDFTGASDLANTLARQGMRTTQYVGIPGTDAPSEVEAGVVALKSRTIPASRAVELALEAADWLMRQGCRQYFFKYCSTFDSTPKGNIGPVAAALADHVGETRVVACPAFPAAGRSIYQGHLFVDDVLLSESGMADHPLTPMRDPDLRRVLAGQTDWPVGHIAAATVFAGADAIADALYGDGRAMLIVDAVRDDDLVAIGKAVAGRKLVSGGSGIALGLPANFGFTPGQTDWRPEAGPGVVLSGSCSRATRKQVAHFRNHNPSREIRAEEVMSGALPTEVLADWAQSQHRSPLIYSSTDPASVRATQEEYGRDAVAHRIEQLFADLACALVARGTRRLVTAGGETSGAVVQALGLGALEIGPQIAAGVPALRAADRPLVLALKSGNFGEEDFFTQALETLGHD